MLIVSKFHDYYDVVLKQTGVDKTCVYNRETKSIEGTKEEQKALERKAWGKKGEKRKEWRPYEYVLEAVVGFAGELHPLIIHTFDEHDESIAPPSTTFLYDLEECKEFLDEKFPETRKTDNDKKFRWSWQLDMSDASLGEFFEGRKVKCFDRIFLEHKAPCFIATSCTGNNAIIEINPNLKEYKFFKVKDPYTAFQEIYMYLSGVIGMADRDTAEVGNDDRLAQRGFTKYSFRKDPTKKKNR